ncbi:PREDICTED: CAP-Gly domain-containing linker protein 1-like [Vollenhovia emeryi]|uniref:CAP-Gly domain-containing linker protein 1-like n=1 Tax=Vollenhovia emeryi TaxID=411798 RepID=UPI0005F370A1|nr:PREDICTED: CAP-Gly domain-containing linker protein 1-like [Vollenhovia emeryi]
MDMDSAEGHDDPQFVKVLGTCLKMEIAAVKGRLDGNVEQIKQLKAFVRSELKRRKELKGKITQLNKIKLILSETLTKLYISINEISDTVETMKANADDQYKLIQLRSQEYQGIVAEYKETWHEYRAMYEEFPLAKARNAAKFDLEKLKIKYMVTSYKKAEMMTIIKQRRRINWIRTRGKIVEFVTVMMERLKLEENFTKLKENVKRHGKEFQSVQAELQVLRRKEEDQKRQRKQKMLEMAPPKINIPFREMYAQNQMRTRVQHEWKQVHEPLDDTISVNTLYLEELCISENSVAPEEINVKATRDNDYNITAAEASDPKNTVVSEKDGARDALVASNAKPSVEKVTLTDDDVEMKETGHEETQKSPESVKTQPSCRIKEGSLKHSAVKNTPDEIGAKRMRLQRQDSKGSINKITAPQPSSIVRKLDFQSSPPSLPVIKKIETVRYNIAPLMPVPKPVQHSTTAASSSVFSPTHYDFCDSNMSSFDQDFQSKGVPSLHEGSLCNFRLSPISNISAMYVDEDAQMAPPLKPAAQQDNKSRSDDKTTSAFDFNNFIKKNKRGDMSFF